MCLHPDDFGSDAAKTDQQGGKLGNRRANKQAIPPELIGAPINSVEQCYAARGLARQRPDLYTRIVAVDQYEFLVDRNGVKRYINGPAVYGGCGLNRGMFVKLSHDDFFAIPRGPDLGNANECQQVMAEAIHAQGVAMRGQWISQNRGFKNGGSPVYLMDNQGYRR